MTCVSDVRGAAGPPRRHRPATPLRTARALTPRRRPAVTGPAPAGTELRRQRPDAVSGAGDDSVGGVLGGGAEQQVGVVVVGFLSGGRDSAEPFEWVDEGDPRGICEAQVRPMT